VSYRNIIVLVDETATSAPRIGAAVDLAARFGASLTGMFLKSGHIPAFVVGDAFTAVTTLQAYVEERDETIALASVKARARTDRIDTRSNL
jgi:nucleotide-binding universal stress UspA family protein